MVPITSTFRFLRCRRYVPAIASVLPLAAHLYAVVHASNPQAAISRPDIDDPFFLDEWILHHVLPRLVFPVGELGFFILMLLVLSVTNGVKTSPFRFPLPRFPASPASKTSYLASSVDLISAATNVDYQEARICCLTTPRATSPTFNLRFDLWFLSNDEDRKMWPQELGEIRQKEELRRELEGISERHQRLTLGE